MSDIETLRTVVLDGQCDGMGHLNTQHYMALFDLASQYLAYHVLGHGVARQRETSLGWADAAHEIDYRREVLAGAPVLVLSRILRVGTTSFAYEHRLVLAGAPDDVCARMTATTVQFDLKARRACPLLPDVRARAGRHCPPAPTGRKEDTDVR